MAISLYICYFGIREPLVQTQVIPYLRELLKDGHQISLLTFEPAEKEGEKGRRGVEEIKEELLEQGISWNFLTYHKWPSAIATAWDVFCGALFIWRRIDEFEILHARTHVPMLMAAMARKFASQKPKLLFDIRGFIPEEYADAGVWKKDGMMFRIAKRVERWLMKEADGFVVLTEKAREILFASDTGHMTSYEQSSKQSAVNSQRSAPEDPTSKIQDLRSLSRPVEVIPCCVDLERRFSGDQASLRESVRNELSIANRKVMVHLGALGGLYLTSVIADLIAAAKQVDTKTFALFLTQSDGALIEPLLIERGFGDDDYWNGRVSSNEIEGHLCASDVGLSFVKASYATQSRSPTKIPEYLACGLPIIANSGVGDVDELITANQVGVLVDEFTPEAYSKALREIEELGDVADRCRDVARREFDLETVGGVRYRRIYSELLGRGA